METYQFFGKIHPERAQISVFSQLGFEHLTTAASGRADVSIILNQLMVTIYSDTIWDIYTLRNIVLNIVNSDLTAIGYLKGYAYDVEVTRALNALRGLDEVFGIDVPCIALPRKDVALDTELDALRLTLGSRHGMYINRCFADLTFALRHADDTAFYCYRAIEALRRHCAASNGIEDNNRAVQWRKFREVANVDEGEVRNISEAAKDVRHAGFANFDSEGRAKILTQTWAIVDRYLAANR
jgi:hypothetical protein